jgi:hypothetical protein
MGMIFSTHGAKKNVYRILVRNPGGERPLGRPKSRGEDNINLDLRETGWGGMDRINLAKYRGQ